MLLHARAKPFPFLAIVCLSWWLFWPAPGHAPEPSRPFGNLVEEWNRSLGLIEQELARGEITAPRVDALRKRLATIRQEGAEVQRKAGAVLAPLRARLEALGPPPLEGEPAEPGTLGRDRRNLAEEVVLYESRIKQTQLVLSRLGQLQRKVQARAFGHLIEDLLRQGALPLAPDTITRAVPEFLGDLGQVIRSPVDWWRQLSPDHRDLFLYERLLLVLTLTFGTGWALRYALLRWCGHDPAIAEPAYARRFMTALAKGLANGIIPALILAGLLFRLTSEDALASGLFQESLAAFCSAAIFFVLAWALPRAVLSPDLPAWRLVRIPPENAKVISRRIAYLAAVMAFDIFFGRVGRAAEVSGELLSFYLFLTNSLEAIGVLALMRGRLWTVTPMVRDERSDSDSDAPMPAVLDLRPFWTMLRLLITAVAVVVIPISLAGYVNLGAYLIKNLVISGAIVGVLFLLRGLGREIIGAAVRSNFMRAKLVVQYRARQRIKIWVRVLFDLALLAAGLGFILLIWGVPPTEIRTGLDRALTGVKVGNVTFSLADVLAAVAIFAITVIVTRLIQRLLSDRVLPRSRLDAGVRNSLATGFGYLGITLAVVLGIAAFGLDLSNLAIVAGALSVGIGFGLQNVVNNFVSGVILLVERPVKVGDWIISGAHEGYVKRIRLRATEIETFRRASIFIPNSELLTGALINWTHKDHYGRIDLPVRAAYGSNAEQVIEILMGCLKANETILEWPAPKVYLLAFGDDGLGFEARGFIASIENIYVVETELRLAIYRSFAEAGIEIPVPQRAIQVRNAGPLAPALARDARPPEPAREGGTG